MQKKSKIIFALTMTLFGSIGIFRRYIPLPSGFISMARGFIGAAILVLFTVIAKKKLNFNFSRKSLVLLIFSGIFIGANWILLFESYNCTTVATTTLCYYMSSVFIMIAAPFVFKERIGVKKILCILSATVGMLFITNVSSGGENSGRHGLGIVFGLGAAVFFSLVVLISRYITDVGGYEKAIIELLTAAVMILPYTLLAETTHKSDFTLFGVLMLLVVCIFHTGVAYAAYFSSMQHISAASVAIMSYIDPVVAIILSSIILKERLTVSIIIGAVLIIGAAIISEISFEKLKNK